MDMNSLSHTKWECKYHVVFAPKFWRKVAYGELKQDISGQIKEKQNNDKSIIHLPRQEVAFWGKAREIKGCGSLKRDFYTRFIAEN